MNKTRTVPFNADKAKFGAKVITRCGYPVRIKHFNGKIKPYTVVASVEGDGKERTLSFTELGQYDKCCKSKYDLFIEEEVENDSKNQDETIRKALISYFQYFPYNSLVDSGLNAKDVIAWLKKQCEEKPADNKPKFQEGDWVIFNPGCNAHQIIRVVENATSHTYGYDTVDNYYFNDTAEGVRLWNITDAKDGDVLACYDCIVLFKEIDGLNIKCHCAYHYMNTPMFFVDTLQNKSAFYPATKEQCDTLFQKIKEEGYEWDKEKKELKKIDDKVKKEVKTRRMTYKELSWWLREHPEEHREYTHEDIRKSSWNVYSCYDYNTSYADEEVNEYIRIRKNGGEWMEPLVEE